MVSTDNPSIEPLLYEQPLRDTSKLLCHWICTPNKSFRQS